MNDPSPKPPIERLLEHAAWVRRLGHSLLADPNQVDDAVQETWVAALERPAASVNDGRAWLGGVFRNVLRQTSRSEARRSRREGDSARAEALPGTDELVERAELQEKILQAVLGLPEPYRATLLLRYYEELSAEEIARREGVPGSTVRNRHKRALALLRERFGLDDEDVRRQWSLWLVPLGPSLPLAPFAPEGLAQPAAHVLPAGTAASTSITTPGVLAMSLKALAATVLLLSIGWGTSFAYRQVAERDVSVTSAPEPSAAPASAASVAQAALATPVRQAGQDDEVHPHPSGALQGRQLIDVAEEPSAARVHGRVVDAHGQPLAGVRVFVGGRPSPFAGAPSAALQLLQERMERQRQHELALAQAGGKQRPAAETDDAQRKKLEELHARLVGSDAQRRAEHVRKVEQVLGTDGAAHSAAEPAWPTPDEVLVKWRETVRGTKEQLERSLGDPRLLEKPFEDLAHARAMQSFPGVLDMASVVVGRCLETDADGRFAAELDETSRVYVTLYATPGILPLQLGSWHDTPANQATDAIELAVRVLPTASVSIGVRDETTGNAVPRWIGALYQGERPAFEWEAEGRFERTLELASSEVSTYTAAVREPQWAHAARRFELRPGDDLRIDIAVQSGAGMHGRVVDSLGQPVAGALVYGGDWTELRGDTIFGAYDPAHVLGGVHTDETGAFRLPGHTWQITAWHPELSATTVRSDEAATIVLEARATITGRIPLDAPRLGDGGEPVVFLDRDEHQRAAIDASGFFAFENVEAGVHGLQLQGGAFLGVHVRPGETLHVTWDDIQPGAVVELEAGGVPVQGAVNGYVTRLGDVFTQTPFHAATKGGHPLQIHLKGQRRGSYLLYTDAGSVTSFELSGERTVADLGTADLTVQGRPGQRVWLVPAEQANVPIVTRIATLFPRQLDEAGTTTFGPLPAGRYAVGVDGAGIVTHVTVDGVGSRVQLP